MTKNYENPLNTMSKYLNPIFPYKQAYYKLQVRLEINYFKTIHSPDAGIIRQKKGKALRNFYFNIYHQKLEYHVREELKYEIFASSN